MLTALSSKPSLEAMATPRLRLEFPANTLMLGILAKLTEKPDRGLWRSTRGWAWLVLLSKNNPSHKVTTVTSIIVTSTIAYYF